MAGKKIALLIGNGKFAPQSGFAQLRCPANDVKAMSDLLQDKVHADFQVTPLVDATQQQITKAIYETLNATAGFDDTVLIYYSGHGCPDDDGSLFLAASDSVKAELPITAVPTNFLYSRMRAAKSQRIFLILDCCFSGSIEKAFTKGEVSDQVKTALPKQFSGSGSYVLTASTDTQLAEEKEGDGNSLLTKHILSGITDGTADGNDDGIVTIHELVVHVQQAVGQEGTQRPWGFELRAGGGEMVFAQTGIERQTAKAKEVEEAVWKARDQFHLPMKTAQCIWSMISDEELRRGGDAGRRRLNKLHSLIDDPAAFVDEVYTLAEAVQRNTAAHDAFNPDPRQTTDPQRRAESPTDRNIPTVPQQQSHDPRFVTTQHDIRLPPPVQPPPRKRGLGPVAIAFIVIAIGVGLLVCVGVAIGIAKYASDSVSEPTSVSMNTQVQRGQQPSAGIVFNFSSDSCGGTVYQTDDTHWMNALTGTCASLNGPVQQVERTPTHVVLKGANSANYATVPLSGGPVYVSTYGLGGAGVLWGYVQRADSQAK